MIAAENFLDAYLKFTRVLNQFEVREEDHTIRVPEKVIRYIWNNQLFCTQSQNNCLQCPFPNVIGKYFS